MDDKQKKIAALDYSNVISEVFSIYFKRFLTLVATAIIIYGVPSVLFYLLTGSDPLGAGDILSNIVDTVLQLFLVGFIVLIVKEYLVNKEVAFLDNLKMVAPRAVSLFLSTILKSIIIFAGLILLIFPGIYLAVRLSLSESAIVNEGLGPIEGLKRSFEMNKSINWHVFSIGFIFFLITFAILIALLILSAIVYGLFGFAFDNGVIEFIGGIVAIIVFAAVYVFVLLWQPVVYFRLLAVEKDQEGSLEAVQDESLEAEGSVQDSNLKDSDSDLDNSTDR